jgi:hypothetical protein
MKVVDESPIELNISSDKVCFIVIKAREFDVKVEPVDPDPGSNATDDGEEEVLGDYDGDLTEAELRAAIGDLNIDEVVDLTAMVWLGRGDFDRASWAEARRLAREREQSEAADYLLGLPLLGDYLEEGFSILGHSCADAEAEHL